jgi:hypothetical protein
MKEFGRYKRFEQETVEVGTVVAILETEPSQVNIVEEVKETHPLLSRGRSYRHSYAKNGRIHLWKVQ